MLSPTSSHLCAPFEMERNARLSVTIVAAQQRPTHELTIVYGIDDVAIGIPSPARNRTDPSMVPRVLCNGRPEPSRLVGCHGYACRIELAPPRTCTLAALDFPSLGLQAHFRLCTWKRTLPSQVRLGLGLGLRLGLGLVITTLTLTLTLTRACNCRPPWHAPTSSSRPRLRTARSKPWSGGPHSWLTLTPTPTLTLTLTRP